MSVQLVGAPAVPLNVTTLVPWAVPKPVPVIVTTVPTGPDDGLRFAMFGADASSEVQRGWFNMTDILFSGALLAGGGDTIHKLLDLYRKFVESSAAKAAGTKP